MTSKLLRAEPIERWFEANAEPACAGDLQTENLMALLGADYRRSHAWEFAVEAFATLLELIRDRDDELHGMLVVPLLDSDELMMEPPVEATVRAELHELFPPTLGLERDQVLPRWQPFELYGRPLPWSVRSGTRGQYVTYREIAEMERGDPYARQLVFEDGSKP